jgi:thiol-disulfide isomerase/thioredoxin
MRLSIRTFFLFFMLLPGLLSADVGGQAADFNLSGEQGGVALSRYQGKVIYLDFWASWCGPCRASFPWMNQMASRYAADGLVVIAINLDKDRALAERFMAELKPRFTIAFDPTGEVAESYGVEVMPSAYLIDRDGFIRREHRGFQRARTSDTESEILSLLR